MTVLAGRPSLMAAGFLTGMQPEVQSLTQIRTIFVRATAVRFPLYLRLTKLTATN